MRSSRIRSLRRRFSLWIGGIFTVAIVGLTGAAVVGERSLVASLQKAAGESLVAHLAAMPEFHGDANAARRHVAALAPAVSAGGATLELGRLSDGAPAGVTAKRRLDLDGVPHELRYRADATWLSRVTWRALALHLAQGVVALALLIGAMEWILRTRLIAPLARIAHQVRFMSNGGGWSPRLPDADAELGEVERAVAELGPALHAQVQQWIEAERRAAIALALGGVRARLREHIQHALAIAGDLQARDAVVPDAKPRIRALVAEIEKLTAAVREIERESFGRSSSATDSVA